MPTAWIVVPTYDEAENLDPLLAGIRAAVAACDPPVDAIVLIVDDDSPDGTGARAAQLAATRPWLRVLRRARKEGLAAAYAAGFRAALDGGADLVVQMDADLSHDPADIPRLIERIRDGADVVVGSRYLAGGSMDGWSAGRRLLSRAGGRYAAAVLGLKITDPTGGFKAMTARALRVMDPDRPVTRGYGFQIEMNYAAVTAGLRVEEIAIVFRERERGVSKMSLGIALEALWRVPLMRLHAHGHATPRLPAL